MDEVEKFSKAKINLSRSNLYSMLENSPYGIVFATIEGDFLYTNRYYQEMIGYTDEELLDLNFYDFTYHEDLSKNQDLLRNAAENKSITKFQKRYVTKEGEIISVRIIAKVILDENGEKLFMALAENITDLVDYQTKLEQAEINLVRSQRMNAISQLSSSLAHDFNNILTVIIGLTELLELELDDNPTLKEYVLDIAQAASQATSITSKLLMTTPQDIYDKKWISVQETIEDLQTTLRTITGDQINLSYNFEENCMIFADKGQIEQVLINMIINARDAIDGDGKISISVTYSNDTIYDLTDYAIISIRDTGHGIADIHLPYIFEPFFTTKEDSKGIGLGLTSVYGIIKNLDGKIDTLTSIGGDGEDSWTEFKIYLPAKKIETKPQSIPSTNKIVVKHTNIISRYILLVDDNEDVLKMLCKNLERYHTVDQYTDATLIDIEDIDKYDIVITDISMPKLDGPGFLEKIRVKHKHLPVLFISGYTDAKISKYLHNKETSYLKKPILISELLEKIETMVKECDSEVTQ